MPIGQMSRMSEQLRSDSTICETNCRSRNEEGQRNVRECRVHQLETESLEGQPQLIASKAASIQFPVPFPEFNPES